MSYLLIPVHPTVSAVNAVAVPDSAFYNIPEAFSVRLTTNADVAGKRLFNDN